MAVIDIIQCIGRCLRNHANKTKSYILAPIHVTTKDTELFKKDDFSAIKIILKAIGTTDDRIIEQFSIKDSKPNNFKTKKFVSNCENIEYMSDIKIGLSKMEKGIDVILCDRWGISKLGNEKNFTI